MAEALMGCIIGSGLKALISFWFDKWSTMGVLLDVLGSNGPLTLGIPIDATVAGVCDSNGWHLSLSRVGDQMPSLSVMSSSTTKGAVVFTWGTDLNQKNHFSTKVTWNYFRPQEDKKTWAPAVWGNTLSENTHSPSGFLPLHVTSVPCK